MMHDPVERRRSEAEAPVAGDELTSPDILSVEALAGVPTDVDPAEERRAREKVALMARLLWNRRRLFLRLSLCGLALSTAIAFLIPKRFESTTRLMPPDQTSSSMAMLAAAAATQTASGLGSNFGGVASDLLGLKSSGALFIGILQSRTVLDDVITRFDLRKLYGDPLWKVAREELLRNTGVSEDRKSGIITIQVTDKSPQRAAAIAEEYVEELNRAVTQLNTSSAHRERVFLEERLVQVKQDLEAAEKGFSEFASKNTAIDIQAQGKAMIEAAATLEGQLIAAQTELQGLKQVYTAENVRVRATQARVDELQQQLQRIGGKFDSTPESNRQNNRSMYPSIRQLPLLGVRYSDLTRNTKVQEAIYEALTREYEIAKVEEAKETPTVKVIDSPDVPEWKSFPPRLEIIFVGTTLAVLAGVVWIFAEELWVNTDPQDPQKVLALEIYQAAKARLPWASQNRFGVATARVRIWSRSREQQLDKQS